MLLGMPTNSSIEKTVIQHELDTEIQRVIALIRQAEERLDVQQRLLSELQSSSSTQVELTMYVYRELVCELITHLAHLNELKGWPDSTGEGRSR
jgi:hypothetical protein